MNLVDCYKLSKRQMDSSRLMLDPNNPRLSLEWNAGQHYSGSQLCSKDVQDQVYQSVLAGKHRVSRLILSISQKGFVPGSQPMIVKRIGNSSDYLVLEGNRRTAAIRSLLVNKHELRPGISQSIRKIPVEVFEYVKNSQHDEDEVVDVLLGTIHIEGPQEWGAMEKAYYVYRGYARELVRMRKRKTFTYDTAVARAVGEHYSISANAVKKTLGIYRVFQQLRNQKYDVNADDYSLIDMALSSAVAKEFFEYDTGSLRMNSVGLEQFSAACLVRDAAIKNPPGFNAFKYVLENGTEHERNQVVVDGVDPQEIKARTRQRVQKRVFVERLAAIKQDLQRLKPTDFRGTLEETRLIEQVDKLVRGTLLKLTKTNGSRKDSVKRKVTTSKPQ
jgi:hypothetical protein